MLGLNAEMSLFERTYNVIADIVLELIHTYLQLPTQDAIMRKYFGNDLPPIKDLLLNTSLVLVNYHHSFTFPRPYVPNMINIAGIHIKPVKPLPHVSMSTSISKQSKLSFKPFIIYRICNRTWINPKTE